jgi:hypothetical protein
MAQLLRATKEQIIFAKAIQEKLAEIFNTIATRRGGGDFETILNAIGNQKIIRAITATREMHKRYSEGKVIDGEHVCFHTVDELNAELLVARWCIDTWHELNGTTPPQTIWHQGHRVRAKPA